MNTYTLLVSTDDAIEMEKNIITHMKPHKGNVVSPQLDTHIFASPLEYNEVSKRVILVLGAAYDKTDTPWTLLQVAQGSFSGGHPIGTSSRLEHLFEQHVNFPI